MNELENMSWTAKLWASEEEQLYAIFILSKKPSILAGLEVQQKFIRWIRICFGMVDTKGVLRLKMIYHKILPKDCFFHLCISKTSFSYGSSWKSK